jgi:NitT/TauT family transport system permease protein
MKSIASTFPAVLALTAGLIAWQTVVSYYRLPPILLPGPKQVLQTAFELRGPLIEGMMTTGLTAVLGLLTAVVVGTIVAIFFSLSRSIRAALFPYVIFLQTVPIVAIAPLLITWSGYQLRTVVLVSALISLFPIISNVTAGLISIDPNLEDLFRLYGAGRWQTLWRLRIPTAVSYLVLGMRISCGLAVIGAIVGEFFIGSQAGDYAGLGPRMSFWQYRQRTDALIAAVLTSTLLALALFGAMLFVNSVVLRRWNRR